MKKKTDGGHEIPEEDLREMVQAAARKYQREQRHRRDIADFADRPELFTH